ncbi:MAG: DNA polymerase I [Deltaproteobacteria bacterium CG11_big_fil_rev_8_21_14_0_20_49_13]|nr:MAG: DNA polymerase I [Deltaproteobacteria bacterium CG11_big_fil_rev_8_21_14_0_20_49_13]
MSDKVYLIDGTNYIFRAYYAIRHLSTSKGFPTNAIYGFTTMLLKLIRDEKPAHIAIVFDSGKPSFREEIFPDYKANREAPPDDLLPQFPHIPRVVHALNIPAVSIEGVEADDVIGTLAIKSVREGHKVVIVTGDKDFMQLVNDDISILDTMKEKLITPSEVVEKFGVEPSKVTDILGLAGDVSDNIPGVHGVGPKTALKLIKEFGSIENLIKNADKLEGGLRDKIKSGSKNAEMSKRLATIQTDVDIKIDSEDLILKKPDEKKLHDILKEFEFSTLLSELAPKSTISYERYRTIMTEVELDDLIKELKKAKIIAFDTETTSLDAMEAALVGLSFSWGEGLAAYIPVGHAGLDAAGQLDRTYVLERLSDIFSSKDIKKAGQNLKYDLAVLDKYHPEINGIEADTMIASYVINPAGSHGMDDLSQQYLDHTTIKYVELTGKGKNQKNFSDVEVAKASTYAAEDADVTLRLYHVLIKELKGQLKELYFDIEMPLMKVLLKMELTGIKVDLSLLNEMGRLFEKDLKELEKNIYKEAGREFNINSPKQLGVILFEEMGLTGGKKTKTGFSTDVDALTTLSHHYKIGRLILNYRSLSKLKGTYIDALPLLVDKRTGRIHTSYNQTVAETGRLSSSDPNLQNIPIRTKEGKRIREAFIAEKGCLLLSADYSQIELRVLAHMAGEESLINAFQAGVDVHSVTAAGIFGVKVKEVTKEQRAVGKTVNFATIYGQSAFGLSKQLEIDPGTAAEYIDNYFKKYPRVAKYREKILADAGKTGFVETLFGRRRYLPDVNSRNGGIRQIAERMAFNTVIQGTAADIIKMAMINIDRELEKVSPGTKMLLQVHDELVFEIPEKDLKCVEGFVKEKMERAVELNVPIVVDIAFGKNWAEC